MTRRSICSRPTTRAPSPARRSPLSARVLPVEGTSIWVPSGEMLHCRGAIGDRREALSGLSVPAEAIEQSLPHEVDTGVAAAPIVAAERTVAVVRVTRSLATHGGFSPAERETLRRLDRRRRHRDGERQPPRRQRARCRRDLARAGAHHGDEPRDHLHARSRPRPAHGGQPRQQSAQVRPRRHRALRARRVRHPRGRRCRRRRRARIPPSRTSPSAPRGRPVSASRSTSPSAPIRGPTPSALFVQIFGEDLERDGAMSGLYLPLKDEEGIVGILLFEASRPDFATAARARPRGDPREPEHRCRSQRAAVPPGTARRRHRCDQREEGGVLRAARAAPPHLRRRGGRDRPRRADAHSLADARRRLDPVFRPLVRADVRADAPRPDRPRVRARRDGRRARSAVAHLRDDERRAERDAALAAVAGRRALRGHCARRVATPPKSGCNGCASTCCAATPICSTNRSAPASFARRFGESCSPPAPTSESDRTPRPAISFAVVGRTDSLELEFGVDQRDVTRVRVGDEVRLRVAALPQQTFSGRVVVRRAAVRERGRGRVVPGARRGREPGRARCVRGWRRTRACSPSPHPCSGGSVATPCAHFGFGWWRFWS